MIKSPYHGQTCNVKSPSYAQPPPHHQFYKKQEVRNQNSILFDYRIYPTIFV